MMLIVVSTLVFTIHTITLANASAEQVAYLSLSLDSLRSIQLSQASYGEVRINTLSERLDTSTNRLEGRMSIVEARQRLQ